MSISKASTDALILTFLILGLSYITLTLLEYNSILNYERAKSQKSTVTFVFLSSPDGEMVISHTF